MGFNSTNDFQELFDTVKDYFSNLNLYQSIAWGAIALGLIMVLAGILL